MESICKLVEIFLLNCRACDLSILCACYRECRASGVHTHQPGCGGSEMFFIATKNTQYRAVNESRQITSSV